ncbi:GGDEF domain-containing protein [Edaphobacter aggregans]|uniref:GGDEF domain-containing protein n=1 Tax=Edaphobacter aggregans TaxID=570835 RepID=UPI0005587160|nr:GGDEF domain-containing protein [Edaphobacter aggregans]
MSTARAALKEVVQQQISRLSGLGFCRLLFPRELEDRFEDQTAQARCTWLARQTLIAILFYDLFLFARYTLSAQGFVRALVVRLFIVTPIALAVNFTLRRRPGKIFREASIAAVACLAGLSNLYLISGRGPVMAAYGQLAVLSIALWLTIVARIRFPYAVAAAVTMLLGDIVFLRYDQSLLHNQKIFGFSIAFGLVLLTVLANYSFGKEDRLNFLLQLRSDLLVADLNRLNAHLLRRSESDALTGLANRHSFDAQFAELWRKAVIGGTVLSVIVVDVDRFKQLNDRYGHLYGDQVLKRIGSLLQQALRAKDDYAARFGGEEFVILLPATHQSAAFMVAERLRKMVELAGFPALDPSQRPYDASIKATVSCGVATAYPTAEGVPEHLLEAADRAMYQAKAQGRNAVCCAPAGRGGGLALSTT